MQESARAAVSHIRARGRRSRTSRARLHRHVRPARPRAGRRDSQGRTVGGRHDGDRDRLGAAETRPVREDVAMTGEITLSGLVLPVGGIREKALAARRHGIKTSSCRRATKPDLAELAAGTESAHDVRSGSDARGNTRHRAAVAPARVSATLSPRVAGARSRSAVTCQKLFHRTVSGGIRADLDPGAGVWHALIASDMHGQTPAVSQARPIAVAATRDGDGSLRTFDAQVDQMLRSSRLAGARRDEDADHPDAGTNGSISITVASGSSAAI